MRRAPFPVFRRERDPLSATGARWPLPVMKTSYAEPGDSAIPHQGFAEWPPIAVRGPGATWSLGAPDAPAGFICQFIPASERCCCLTAR
jgi:hypothetical protein